MGLKNYGRKAQQRFSRARKLPIARQGFLLTAATTVIFGLLIGFILGHLGIVESNAEASRPYVPATSAASVEPLISGWQGMRNGEHHAAWRRYAQRIHPNVPNDKPLISLVVDDLGLNRKRADALIDFPVPLTLAFLPYGAGLEQTVSSARKRGHEILVHVPMESTGGEYPGPNALLTGSNVDEAHRRLSWSLSRFEGYVGINNHMGSRFTADKSAMQFVMKELARRELLFLDSRTTPETQALRQAKKYGVPATRRDVFLDNKVNADSISIQLVELAKVAKKKGTAVGIFHPHWESISVVRKWIGENSDTFAFTPISHMIERRAEQDLAQSQ